MRYNFHVSALQGLDPRLDYTEDGQSEIFDVLVDTLISGQIDIYLVYENAKMKKLSSKIT